MNILIFGKGWLGDTFRNRLDLAGHNAEISSADITDARGIWAEIAGRGLDAVINCAGARDIDWCEDHKKEAYQSNVLGPLTLEKVCEKQKQYWVHIGAGGIYHGPALHADGWREDDPPNFHNTFYGRTKIMIEQLLRGKPVLQLRMCAPVTGAYEPQNLITRIVRQGKVVHHPISITAVDDLVTAAAKLIWKRATGVYNVANPCSITRPRILDLYKEIICPSYSYETKNIVWLERSTRTGLPQCVLSGAKLAKEHISLRTAEEAVRDCLKSYKLELLSWAQRTKEANCATIKES